MYDIILERIYKFSKFYLSLTFNKKLHFYIDNIHHVIDSCMHINTIIVSTFYTTTPTYKDINILKISHLRIYEHYML